MSERDDRARLGRFGGKRLDDRKVDQLIGLCEGVLADGAVNLSEAQFIQQWLMNNVGIADRWPANVIYGRLCEYLEDGLLDEQEEAVLLDLLMDVCGMPADRSKSSARLPLCEPAPDIEFSDNHFVMTGKFVSGTRSECEDMVRGAGGIPGRNVSGKTRYVVIGTLVSDSWAHESYGRKIEAAVALRDEGSGVSIVSEEHWARWLQRVN
jgi:NAD-dependent DNA ligase